MALTNTIIMGTYKQISGDGNFIKVGQGGTSYIPTTERKWDTAAHTNATRLGFTWGGNIYMPSGSWRGQSYGYASYNPNLNMMEFQGGMSIASANNRYIPMGEYLLSIESGNVERMNSPYKTDVLLAAGTFVGAFNDYVILGNTIYGTNAAGGTYTSAYPFTVVPVTIGGVVNITRLCVFNGSVYGLKVTAGVCTLYQYAAGVWNALGAGFTPVDSADLQATAWCCVETSFFEYNGNLWALFSYNTPGTATQWVRCYQMDLVGGVPVGTATQFNALVPDVWKVVPNHIYSKLFEVIDDTGPTRKVYIVRCGDTNALGIWEMCEFSDVGTGTLVAQGADCIYPYCGVVWDQNGKGSSIESVVDSVPSSYVTAVIRTSDLSANDPVDIDPRYNDLTTPSAPPHTICTEKFGVGSEGKTALSSKPAGITTLADLSDDFADGIIDPDLWTTCNPHYEITNGMDYGLAGRYPYNSTVVSETAGRIAFGGILPLPTITTFGGVGVVSNWNMVGDFQVDVIISVANLTNSAGARSQRLFIKIFESANICYGIQVHNNAAVFKANGFSFRANTGLASMSVDSAAIIDGQTLRISRTGSAWVLLANGISVAPSDMPQYTGPVRILLGASSTAATNFANATPGPGFEDIAVSGAGSLGRYNGCVRHNFMWDHVADLGAGFVGATQMYTDS